MKKVLTFCLAVVLLLSCLTVIPFAEEATEPKDFVIAPGAIGSVIIFSGTNTPQGKNADAGVWSTTTFDGKEVFQLTCVNDPDNTTSQAGGCVYFKGVNQNVADYNYVLVTCYYQMPEGFVDEYERDGNQLLKTNRSIDIDNINNDKWIKWEAVDEENNVVKVTSCMNKWTTLAIPINAADVSDGVLQNFELRLIAYGWDSFFEGTVFYVEAVALSADRVLNLDDKVIDVEVEPERPPQENYLAENYTVPNEAFYGGVPGTTVEQEAEFDGRTVVKLTKGPVHEKDPSNDWPITVLGENQHLGYDENAMTNPLNIRLGDYKYIVIKSYYDLNTLEWPINVIPSLQLKQVDDVMPWKSFNAKAVASSGALANAVVREDRWQYFVFDMTETSYTDMVQVDTTKYPYGFESIIMTIQLYMFGNGRILNSALGDDDVVYIEFFTFTNDYEALVAADKAANQTVTTEAGQTTTEDLVTTTEPVITTEVPETTTEPTVTAEAPITSTEAPAGTEKPEDTGKAGCKSAVDGSFAFLAICCFAGALALTFRRKRKGFAQ